MIILPRTYATVPKSVLLFLRTSTLDGGSDRRGGDLFYLPQALLFFIPLFPFYTATIPPLYRHSFAGGSLPVGTCFFRCKGIAPEAHPSTACAI